MMSFHATKVFHTIEGGALLYKDHDLKKKLASLRNFGLTSQEECEYTAMNAKMNEFQAAMGLCNLLTIDEDILKRKKAVEIYQRELKNIPGITCWQKQDNVEANYIYFPIVIDEKEYGLSRDQLFELLKSYNINSRKYFYPLVTDFKCYQKYKSYTPIADDLAKKVLTLPLYSDLETADILKICDIIRSKKGV